MKTNIASPPIRTHEGAVAKNINAEQQLRRSVMSCMLFEGEFYESGEEIAKRIGDTIKQVRPEAVAAMAVEAREKMKLRHVPLLIVSHMAALLSHKALVSETLTRIIQRPDELAEFVAIHAKLNPGKPLKKTLSAQIKRGLAVAFTKFDEYGLAKYNRDGAVKLRDVLFLCHAKAKDEQQAAVWKRLIDGTLSTPDTWEVELSASQDKLASWTRLLSEKKLGALAMLRNLRNMQQAKVPDDSIRAGLTSMKTERVLPFRFISAARYAPQFEPELEAAMFKCVSDSERLSGNTVLAIDTSGSMGEKVSAKSELSRRDAAAALAMLLREICDKCRIIAFGTDAGEVPPRRGFGLSDAIGSGCFGHGTNIGLACAMADGMNPDRIIVITDEQSATSVSDPRKGVRGYFINVASARNGIGYGGWTHIDGWSESIIEYIRAFEKSETE